MECIVRVLTVVASVEILDVYALVGPLDSFDYRHVSKIHGLPTDPSSTRYIFTIDPNVIPREKVWQLQLKLSSSAQGLMTIQVDELTVQVDRANGLADFDRTGKSVGNASEVSECGTTNVEDLNLITSHRASHESHSYMPMLSVISILHQHDIHPHSFQYHKAHEGHSLLPIGQT